MKVSLLFPSRFLKAADLEGPTTLTIAAVVVEELRTTGGKEKKPLIYFVEREDKALVLNRTNAMLIAAQHGEETAQWEGKQIVILPTRVPFGPKIVDAIRVQEVSK